MPLAKRIRLLAKTSRKEELGSEKTVSAIWKRKGRIVTVKCSLR